MKFFWFCVRGSELFLPQLICPFSANISISWCAVYKWSKGFKTKTMLKPHWLLQSWICKYKWLCWGKTAACLVSIRFLQVASARYFRKAACDFNFFGTGKGITAVSGHVTSTDVIRSLNTPWHRRLFLIIYIKSEDEEVAKHVRSEDKLLDFPKFLQWHWVISRH